MKRAGTISRAGFTLVELLVALVVISIISVAVVAMLAGATNTSLYVKSGTDTVSQVEMGYRRMLHNLRACSAITFPLGTTAAASVTLNTQNDPQNANQPRTVTYAVSSGSLIETDVSTGLSPQKTQVSTLVTGVTNFSVTRTSMTKPQTVTISITAGNSPAVTRTVVIYCRDL